MKKKVSLSITILCTLYTVLSSYAANRFWIAGSTANWNSTANWSTTSGGSSGASVPGSGDVAKFDGNGTGNCTIDATVNVAGVDIASGYSGTISQGSYVITIGGTGFTMAGGTFTGGSAKIDINSTFALSSGSFTATSDTLYIGGNSCGLTFLTHSGGTFSHNNGTVTLDPNQQCSPYYGEINIITSTLFYNIRIATPASNTAISVNSGDTVKAANNIEHASGYLHGSCWSLLGNLTVGSNAGGGSTGQIIFTGTNTQTYTYGSAGRTSIITINKASGTVSAASGTTGFAVKGLKIINGDFTAPSGDFYISGTICNADPIFDQTGGAFAHNNGRVIFDANQQCSPYYATINVNTSTLFYDIKIAGAVSSSGLNVSTGDTVKAAHNLEHDAGYLGGSCWSLQGNLTVGSNAGGGSSGQIIFTGTNTQTYAYGSAGRTGNITINKASGTVSPASGTTGFAVKALKIVSGSFTAPTGDFYISGTFCNTDPIFNQTGGAFSHNNGRVIFDANQQCSPYYATINVNSSTLFYDVKIAGATSASQISVSSGDTVKAANNIEHASGYLMGSCWSLQGNLTVGSNAGGGNGGQIIFTGTNTQTYAYGSAGRTAIITVNKASGTVNAASGTTDFAVSGFRQSSGTFNAPAGNFFTGGFQLGDQTIFDQTGGTFNPNNGIAVFDPYSGYNYKIKPATTLFYKVTAKPVGYLTLHTSSDTLKVANNLKLEQGYFNTGVLVAKANVTVNSGWNGGSAQLLFGGAADQDFDLTGATTAYNGNIKINKPSGKVNLLSAAVLDQSSQTLTFVKGNIVSTASNLLTIGHGVTVSGASDTSYVDGPVKKVGNAAFIFPVGKSNHYRKIGISAPSTSTDAYTAEYFNGNSNNTYLHSSKDGSITKLSRNEYWNLDRTTGSTNVSVTLSWDSAVSCTVDNTANVKVCVWDGSLWKDKSNGATTGNVYIGTVTSSSTIGTFGMYTLGTSGVFGCDSYSYTWNGSSSSTWNTVANWTPAGYPQAEDNATIVTTSNQPVYNGVEGLTNLTMTSGTLDLNTYTLPITGVATFNGGTINNGKINTSGSSTVFAGTTFGAKVAATSPTITFSSTTFNDSITATAGTSINMGTGSRFTGITTFSAPDIYNSGPNRFYDKVKITKTSNTANTWSGGNLFDDSLTITNTGTSYIRMANSAPGDTLSGNVVLNNTSSGAIFPAYTGNNTFAGNIVLKGSGMYELGKGGGSVIMNGGNGKYIRYMDGSTTRSFTVDKPGDYTSVFKRLNISNDFMGKLWETN